MGKWPWQCTTRGLDNSTELQIEKICQAVTEIWVPQVWQPPAQPPGLWRQYSSSQEGWGVKTWSSSPDRRARVRTRSCHGPDCWGPEVCLISKIWRLEYNGMAQNISCHAKLQISSMEMRSLWQKKAGHRVTRTILVPQFSKWRLKQGSCQTFEKIQEPLQEKFWQNTGFYRI